MLLHSNKKPPAVSLGALNPTGISDAEANHRKEVKQLTFKPPSFTPLGPVTYLSEKQDYLEQPWPSWESMRRSFITHFLFQKNLLRGPQMAQMPQGRHYY